ncbi:unnamed protein product [Ambrosiozyma monospora]|uniref:Unnamed protein product n=1 Tax=Ambrosiozyma monospora TaxID=43982 RepID=A0A9W6Z258_AMBMO|nr:unnamed protein product [Ambrosiozyma monospora]
MINIFKPRLFQVLKSRSTKFPNFISTRRYAKVYDPKKPIVVKGKLEDENDLNFDIETDDVVTRSNINEVLKNKTTASGLPWLEAFYRQAPSSVKESTYQSERVTKLEQYFLSYCSLDGSEKIVPNFVQSLHPFLMDFGRKMLKDTVEKDSELKAIYDETDQADYKLKGLHLKRMNKKSMMNSKLH